jgi:ribonuclease VapC
MVIDTSAIAAILFQKPGSEPLIEQIEKSQTRLISAATLVELSIVVESRKGEDGVRDLDLWLYRAGIEIAPVDADQADIARRAWRRFGKGRHPAGLNFGDCFAYALAKKTGFPLLYKGDDFSLTDLA